MKVYTLIAVTSVIIWVMYMAEIIFKADMSLVYFGIVMAFVTALLTFRSGGKTNNVGGYI